ncbi:reverse transcriptase domain-containing protein [Tanacetum coccineum]
MWITILINQGGAGEAIPPKLKVPKNFIKSAITEGSWGFEHTKACFRDEIIPFVKALKDLFNTFDQYLIDELSEVQNVFHQMEQAVEQHRLESKTFEVKMNQVLNENERLLEQVINKDIVNIIMNSFVDNAYVNVHECEKCLKLETELLNKKDFIEKETYDKLFRSFTTLEKHCISLEVDTQLNQEIFQRDNSVSNQSAPSFDQYFELNELKAQSQEKDTVIKKLKERIKSSNGNMNEDKVKKDIEEIDTISIELDHRVDLEPLSPKLKNNREAHVDYIKITKENANTLLDIIEQARTSNPLDNALTYACMYTKQIQELLVYVSDTCPSSPLKSEKLVPVTPMNKARKVTFAKTSTTSDNNIQIQVDVHQTQTTSKPLVPSTNEKCSTNASRSKPRSETKNHRIMQPLSSNQKSQKIDAHTRKAKPSLTKEDMNNHARAKAVKSIKIKEWKPTGKMFKNVGYKWVPTGRTFTIVRTKCPLTRFTSTKIVPLRIPIKSAVITNKKPSNASQWRLKETNHASSSSTPKIVESRTTNHLEPNNHIGSNVSISPCSSSVQCSQSRRDLPRDIPLDSVVVLRYEKRSKSENKGKVPTEMELVLEQTQQGTSYEVSVSAEGVEELKRKVKIMGEKKEALLTLRHKPEHQSDTKLFTMMMEILLDPTSNKLMIDPHGFEGYLKMEVKRIRSDSAIRQRTFGLRPYHFTYPERRLTMEEMLYKFIDEGKREKEEMRAFIHEFRTTNKILFKERNNSLSELRFEVQGLLKVINNTPISNLEVKGVTTRGGKTTTQDDQDNNTNIHTKEPLVINHYEPVESNEVLTKDQPLKADEPVVQPTRLEKSLEQLDLESCKCEAADDFDSIRRIKAVNTLYLVEQKMARPNKVKREQLYSASANEIDEKKLELKNFSWVNPIHVVLKKRGMIIVLNDNNELIPSRIILRWRVCIDYHKLNDATRKDHFPLPFIDQMLERLCGNEYYCFLDGFLRFFQIQIVPEDQEKTTFTCPYGTFAYQRMSFGLCNVSDTFQRCMMAIFHDMVEDFMEVFMDEFLVFRNSFDCCQANLDKMLARCEETNLELNWEKYHFMVKEGIVLGHKMSGARIEVDRAKINVIAKLPYPTNVKGVRSFLGHAGFYRRFIKDFSMICKPLTQILMKDAKFDFFDDCKKAFNILKEKLTTAPIIISPDWNVPFELMCDTSDFAVGAVLGQRIDGKFKAIYYASKTLNNAQEHYTTTKKNFLQLFSLLINNIMRRCISRDEIREILEHCHSGPTGRHHSASITGRKVYEAGFFWLSIFKDAKDYVIRCDACQRSGNISSRNEMPQNNIQVCDVFDIWGLNFMGPFPNSKGNKYILVAVDYLSKWVKAQALPTNNDRVVIKFLRRLFAIFRVPKALISDRVKNRFMELNELMELRDGAYENTKIYKEKTKRWHDSRFRGDKNFKVGDKVLLFNSRFKMHPGKLKSRWYEPNVVKTVYPYGTIEIIDRNRISFKVNRQRLKKYHDEYTDAEDKEVVEFEQDTT